MKFGIYLRKITTRAASIMILATLLLCAANAAGQVADDGCSSAQSGADMLFMLIGIQADVQGHLNDLDMDLADAARNLSDVGLDGAEAHDLLRGVLAADSNLSGGALLSLDGRIVASEGRGSESAEGADLSGQEHISLFLKTKSPVFSRQIMLVEGYNGSSLVHPVFSQQGELSGGVSVVFEPQVLLNSIVAHRLAFDVTNRSDIKDYSFWMMDTDGLIAYDRDEKQIGKRLFEDPLYAPYPGLLSLGEDIIRTRSGHGYYEFQVTEGDRRNVTKESYWTTAGLHGQEWRLIVTRILP